MNRDEKIREIGEFGLITELAGLVPAGRGVIKGIGDDAAVVDTGQEQYLLLATDAIAENIHFHRSAGPRRIGRKALAVNLSDIAAMGGVPRWALISLGVPKDLPLEFCREIYRGIAALSAEFGVGVVGGDTFRMESEIVISVTLTGEVERERCVFRTGARPGDLIMVTGGLGENRGEKHLDFSPRVREARFLVEHFSPTSMIDISDGLWADLEKLCRSGGVGAKINASDLPVSRREGDTGADIVNQASGGEEFELLFTVPSGQAGKLGEEFYSSTGTRITPIGEITPAQSGIRVIGNDGVGITLEPRGYDHFGGGG